VSDPIPAGVVAMTTHARHVPAAERERFARQVSDVLGERALVLMTCHRVEAYVMEPDVGSIASAIRPPAGGNILSGVDAVRHAISVAAGRDSVVVGEDQILHQLRASVDAARRAGVLEPALDRLFSMAMRAGRRARSWRQRPPRSLADVALSIIERGAGPIPHREILVVGAGHMGRLAAIAAARAGASVTVANRSFDAAAALAASVGGRHAPLDPGQTITRFDGVIVALGGPWTVAEATSEALSARPAVVVDLSVPAAIPARVAERLGSRLTTADDLAHVAIDPAGDDPAGGPLDELIARTTAEFLAWQQARDGRAAARALVRRADQEREAELAALWRRLPDLEPETRDAIEGMTRHLATRLLREPLERLGRDTDGRDERAIRDLFAL